jgi:hypothetical protein
VPLRSGPTGEEQMSDYLRTCSAGINPNGLYRRVCIDGLVVQEGPISFENAVSAARCDGELTTTVRAGQEVRVFIYDGDTGECMSTMVVPA